jgi:hypothetical protein
VSSAECHVDHLFGNLDGFHGFEVYASFGLTKLALANAVCSFGCVTAWVET